MLTKVAYSFSNCKCLLEKPETERNARNIDPAEALTAWVLARRRLSRR
ncbi:hypothetical protein [Collimonas sp.]